MNKLETIAKKIFDFAGYQEHPFHFDTARHLAGLFLDREEKAYQQGYEQAGKDLKFYRVSGAKKGV